VSSGVSDHNAAKPGIANEDVRAQTEYEKRHCCLTRSRYCVCEIVRGRGIVEEVGRTSDPKRGVWREWYVPLESRRVDSVAKSQDRVGEMSVRHGSGKKSAMRADCQR
jgi:hypothetical protein